MAEIEQINQQIEELRSKRSKQQQNGALKSNGVSAEGGTDGMCLDLEDMEDFAVLDNLIGELDPKPLPLSKVQEFQNSAPLNFHMMDILYETNKDQKAGESVKQEDDGDKPQMVGMDELDEEEILKGDNNEQAAKS